VDGTLTAGATRETDGDIRNLLFRADNHSLLYSPYQVTKLRKLYGKSEVAEISVLCIKNHVQSCMVTTLNCLFFA